MGALAAPGHRRNPPWAEVSRLATPATLAAALGVADVVASDHGSAVDRREYPGQPVRGFGNHLARPARRHIDQRHGPEPGPHPRRFAAGRWTRIFAGLAAGAVAHQ